MTYLHYFDQTQRNLLSIGGITVILSPNDIVTLKLLRDSRQRSWLLRNDEGYASSVGRTDADAEHTLEALNRILSQIH